MSEVLYLVVGSVGDGCMYNVRIARMSACVYTVLVKVEVEVNGVCRRGEL